MSEARRADCMARPLAGCWTPSGVQKPRRPRSREPPDPPYEAEAKQNCELHLHVVLYRRDVIDLVEHIDILVVGL